MKKQVKKQVNKKAKKQTRKQNTSKKILDSKTRNFILKRANKFLDDYRPINFHHIRDSVNKHYGLKLSVHQITAFLGRKGYTKYTNSNWYF